MPSSAFDSAIEALEAIEPIERVPLRRVSSVYNNNRNNNNNRKLSKVTKTQFMEDITYAKQRAKEIADGFRVFTVEIKEILCTLEAIRDEYRRIGLELKSDGIWETHFSLHDYHLFMNAPILGFAIRETSEKRRFLMSSFRAILERIEIVVQAEKLLGSCMIYKRVINATNNTTEYVLLSTDDIGDTGDTGDLYLCRIKQNETVPSPIIEADFNVLNEIIHQTSESIACQIPLSRSPSEAIRFLHDAFIDFRSIVRGIGRGAQDKLNLLARHTSPEILLSATRLVHDKLGQNVYSHIMAFVRRDVQRDDVQRDDVQRDIYHANDFIYDIPQAPFFERLSDMSNDLARHFVGVK
jgi:hypothetical protein